MKIPEGIKTCVAFVGFQMADGSFTMAGSVYFIGRDNRDSNLADGVPTYQVTKSAYGVTAKHVIEGIKSKGLDKVFLRLNMTSGMAEWLKPT